MTKSAQTKDRGSIVKRSKLITGILTALALILGSVIATSTVNAGPGCCPSKTAAKSTSSVQTASADEATPVEVTKANVTTANAAACGADGKTARLTSANSKSYKVGAACNLATGKGCGSSLTGVGYAKANVKLMDGETTLAKLAQCGIDLRSADTDFLAASLVSRDCGKYTHQQWAKMIKTAKGLNVETSDAVFAGATSCDRAKDCPLTLVVADLAAQTVETSIN